MNRFPQRTHFGLQPQNARAVRHQLAPQYPSHTATLLFNKVAAGLQVCLGHLKDVSNRVGDIVAPQAPHDSRYVILLHPVLHDSENLTFYSTQGRCACPNSPSQHVGALQNPSSLPKLKLHKRKKLEAIVRSVVENKLKSGKIPGGSTVYLTITVKFNADGSVKSVKVFGDPGYGLKKALKKKLESVSGYKKYDAVEMSVAVNAP